MNHGEALRTIHKVLIKYRREGNKVHVIWLWGQASSGKSYLIRRLREIFASVEVAWKGEYLPATKMTRPEIATQLVTCEEFDF